LIVQTSLLKKAFLYSLLAVFTLVVAQDKDSLKPDQLMFPHGFEKIIKQTPEEIVFNCHYFTYKTEVHYRSGVGAKNLEVKASDFSQLEIDIKSEVSIYVSGMFTLKLGDKTIRVRTPLQTVIPDGNYRRYIFNPTEEAAWDKKATLVEWAVHCAGYTENGPIMGFRRPQLFEEVNLIPGADMLTAQSAPQDVNAIRPLGKYLLAWQGKDCPGVTLRFYDYNLKEIANSAVELKPGASAPVAFEAPEMVIQTKAFVHGQGDGYPQLTCTQYRRRYVPEIFWRGQWIWSRHIMQGPDYSYVWFERNFDLPATPDYSVMGVMADDKSEIYVNGKKVGATYRYSRPDKFILTGLLEAGKNTITIRVYNLDSAAGLCVDLFNRYPGGKEEYMLTDKQWTCQETGNNGDKPDAIAQPVIELGNPTEVPPWAGYIKSVYVGPRGRFTLKKSVNGEFTAILDKAVISQFRNLLFERRTISGNVHKFLLPATLAKNADATVTIRYPALRPTIEPSQVYLADEYWEVEGDKPLAQLPAVPNRPSGFHKAEFVDVGQRTRMKFRGRVYDPTFYKTQEYERMSAMTNVGFHSYVLDAYLEHIWKGLDDYDFSEFDRKFEALLTVDPQAIVLLDIRFYMPEWWLDAYPDDASAYFEKTRRNTYDDVQALGSKHWLEACEAPLKAIMDHVKATPVAERVWGVNISDSRGNEWFWGGATAGTDFYRKPAQAGYSKADYKTFRAMLRRRYKTDAALAAAWNMPEVTIDTAPMPDHKLRSTGSVGCLFDPSKDAQIMDWCRFRNDALAEAIVHFAKRIKFHTDNKVLVGCFYGYYNQLAASARRSQLLTGHNGFMECIKSGVVDFFRAPHAYAYRRPGLPGGIMSTFSSFTLRNTVVYNENDERTVYGPSQGFQNDIYCGKPTSGLESIGQLNREFGMFATTGIAQYWSDNPYGSLYEPALTAALGQQLEAYAKLPAPRGLTPIEVAVVGDIESIYYSTDGQNGLYVAAIPGVFAKLNYLGVPFRNVVVTDLLDKGVAPAHKFYIMLPTLVLSKEQRQALKERFDKENATVLWLYAAGTSYPTAGPKGEFCGDFLGFTCVMETSPRQETIAVPSQKVWSSKFTYAPHFYATGGFDQVIAKNASDRAVVVSKKSGNATHIFSTLVDIPHTLMSDLMTQAGVFRYVTSLDDPLWIGNDLVCLHAATTGEKRISLPKGGKLKPILGSLEKPLASGEAWNALAGMTYVFQVTK